jgi:predicted  nucleic acid-binding Zn-ribbon protein
MKTKIGIALLAAICIGLIVALIVTRNQGDEQQKKATDTILEFSNELTTANINLDEYRQVNLALSNNLSTSQQETLTVSNNLSSALTEAKASLSGAQSQITNLDARVADLEAQNQALDQRAADLTNTIAGLSAQITETQIKLVTSETNNAFLEEELKRQIAEKAAIQHKFDDLATVRTQVKKLRDDALTARRLEWMRQGIDPAKITKGGEVLMQRAPPATNTAPHAATNPKVKQDNGKIPPPLGSNFNLNVEVGSDGSVHVIPAIPGTPAATNPPSH